MGLTIETARNYSKKLYAKLGVRGQAELVRLVYESSAVLG
jgi:DNA-binding CsgD family transcriptional regulator